MNGFRNLERIVGRKQRDSGADIRIFGDLKGNMVKSPCSPTRLDN